jgi:hypothetical protein
MRVSRMGQDHYFVVNICTFLCENFSLFAVRNGVERQCSSYRDNYCRRFRSSGGVRVNRWMHGVNRPAVSCFEVL